MAIAAGAGGRSPGVQDRKLASSGNTSRARASGRRQPAHQRAANNETRIVIGHKETSDGLLIAGNERDDEVCSGLVGLKLLHTT